MATSRDGSEGELAEDPTADATRISRGGPFHDLQAKLGLVRDDDLRPISRALIAVAIAWVVPLVISILEGNAFGEFADMPFLLYLPALSRFLIGVGVLIAMEPVAEHHLSGVLRPLLRAPLLAPSAFPAARTAAVLAIRRRNSRLAEAVCLAIACCLSLVAAFGLQAFDERSWAFVSDDGSRAFSYAALWCLWISSPIYFFLITRWVWRIIVVALLLKSLAGLDLRLTVTHPDGSGGLAFVGGFPNAYMLFVFALSCNLGAGVAERLIQDTINTTSFTALMVGWLLITNGLLALPALYFTVPLGELKTRTLERAQALSTRVELARENEVLSGTICGATEDEIKQSAEIVDPGIIFLAAGKMSTVLIQRAALLPISAAAVLPVFAAGATQLPVKELFQLLRKLLLL